MGIRQWVAELIGTVRTVTRRIIQTSSNYITRDIATADYRFFDRLRNGKAEGLEISGLLVKPVLSKLAGWVMGKPLEFRSDVTDSDALGAWWAANHADLVRAYEESLGLGDSYIVVNADLSVTVVPPNVVEPIVDEKDYSQIIGYRIVERWPHPTRVGQSMTIEDEYTLLERVRRIMVNGVVMSEMRYANMSGYLPVIPIHNNVGSNEVNGTPELAPAVNLLHRYGETLDVTLSGMKRSTPVVSMKDASSLNKFWQQYAQTRTRTLPDGTTETYETIPFSSDEVLAIVGDFKYAVPGSVAADAEKMLVLLYLILIEHAELPEFVMGSAIASSKASAETQMPVWTRYIDKRRAAARRWILQVMRVVQGYMVARGELRAIDENPVIVWERMTDADGSLTLNTIKWAVAEGLMDSETALQLAPVEIEDVKSVIEAAQAEADERRNQAMAQDYGGDLRAAIPQQDPQNDLENAA